MPDLLLTCDPIGPRLVDSLDLLDRKLLALRRCHRQEAAGSRDYDRTVIDTGSGEHMFCSEIDTGSGEHMFCSEDEAKAAGWRAARG